MNHPSGALTVAMTARTPEAVERYDIGNNCAPRAEKRTFTSTIEKSLMLQANGVQKPPAWSKTATTPALRTRPTTKIGLLWEKGPTLLHLHYNPCPQLPWKP
jgi:hypothetical protein